MNPEVPETPDHDPQLEALLDDALAPSPAPPGLHRRILDATAHRLPGHADASRSTGVIGRLGFGARWGFAAAAVLLLAGVVLTFWSMNEPGTTPPGPGPIADGQTTTSDPVLDETEDDPDLLAPVLTRLAEAELAAEPIDDRIDLLQMQLAWVETDGVWAEDGLESLDKAIARHEFETLADDLELYF
jgi:hypothetical protein